MIDVYLVIGIIVCVFGLFAKLKQEIEYGNIVNNYNDDFFEEIEEQ